MSTASDLLSQAEMDQRLRFFERVQAGAGKLNAAYEVGWSPQKLRQLTNDRDFAEMLNVALERRMEDLEETAHQLALRGNVAALQMILYSFGADRGWRPPQQRVQVDHTTKHQIEVVANAKETILEIMRERGTKALQQSFKAIEAQAS